MPSPAAPAGRRGPAWPISAAAAGPALLYGVRLAGAVALALFVAFALQLDNPSWAGTSAAIVCQPVLGASLRKGVFRMVGTVVGATMTVVLTAIFPQDRLGFLLGMALWCALCSFANTVTRNFAAYAFALSGYTMAIIAGDSISAPDQVFGLAVTRAAEIVIGIACAMAVTGLSEVGRSPAHLAAAIDGLGGEILRHFRDLLRGPADRARDGSGLRRGLIGRVAALDPLLDQAIGESPELRHRKAILHDAVAGLFTALSGWRIAESHLVGLAPADAERHARGVAGRLPDAWGAFGSPDRGPPAAAPDATGAADPDHGAGVSAHLLAGAAAEVASGLAAAANGLALLRRPAAARDPARPPGFVVADYLPALVNALRTFVAIGAALAFWILTEWPNGLGAMTFMAVTVLLLAPRQEASARAALGFGVGTVLAACLAAVVDFALLPNHEGFPALALVLAAVLVPLAALSTVPALSPYLVAATMNFLPLVGPTNTIAFDTPAFYNAALGIVGGCLAGALALVLIPPVPKRHRARRLVALTLRDLRAMASGRRTPTPQAWQNRVHARLIALPEGVDAVFGARLVAALSTGLQVLRLRALADPGAAGEGIRASLGCLARRDLDGMLAGLDAVDRGLTARDPVALAGRRDGHPDLRVRIAIRVIRDVMRQHRNFIGAHAP